MTRRLLLGFICLSLVILVAAMGRRVGQTGAAASDWSEVTPGVLRSAGIPAAYALLADGKALLIDAPAGAKLDQLTKHGVTQVELVLLTHHHRDTVAQVGKLLDDKVPVRAPKASAELLLPEGVAKYWKDALPLRNSRTSFLVVPEGLVGIDCTLDDGQRIQWHGWELTAVATPGHSRDHMSFIASVRSGGRKSPELAFTGDALSAPGKIWSPYTTDWDHWTDLGLKPAVESLRKLAELKPTILCPAHGEPIKTDAVAALQRTAANVEEVGFLKSFERFSKQRLGNPPEYRFLAKEQAGTGGDKPWSQLTDHLFYTGNTFALVAQDKSLMVYDPWGKRSVEQIQKLQKERGLGPVELVMFSHAHFDHYDGVYELADRDQYQVWALDDVALPIAEPFRLRAPFLDARAVRFERRFRDGAAANWRDYSFKFHHFPGQTYFTMAVETTIDGKRCLFTGDNFFHVDLYSGTGGWMGLNRSWPTFYRQSAQKLLDLKPEWVLAEHGGAFEFNAKDVKRRVQWAEAAGKAADALSPSGDCLLDWDPHLVQVEPLVVKGKRGETVAATLVTGSVHGKKLGKHYVELWGSPRHFKLKAPVDPRGSIGIDVSRDAPVGRHILPLRCVLDGGVELGADAFVVVDVE